LPLQAGEVLLSLRTRNANNERASTWITDRPKSLGKRSRYQYQQEEDDDDDDMLGHPTSHNSLLRRLIDGPAPLFQPKQKLFSSDRKHNHAAARFARSRVLGNLLVKQQESKRLLASPSDVSPVTDNDKENSTQIEASQHDGSQGYVEVARSTWDKPRECVHCGAKLTKFVLADELPDCCGPCARAVREQFSREHEGLSRILFD
jgi:hypothetical protein